MKTPFLRLRRVGSSGFTLVELLVVITIIGILSALIAVNLAGARERARDTERKNDLRQVQTALRLYFNDFQQYPTSNGSNQIVHTSGGGNQTFSWGSSFEINGNVYMELPTDPVNAGEHVYRYWRSGTNGDLFCMWARLENASDQQIEEAQSTCSTACTGQFDTDEPYYPVCNR